MVGPPPEQRRTPGRRDRETYDSRARPQADRQESPPTPPDAGTQRLRRRPGGPEEPPGPGTPSDADQATSVGDLIGEVAGDLTRLVRNEIDLAKAEFKEEGRKAGKAAAMFGGAGYAVGVALLLASLAAVFGLAHVIGNAWAALIVAAVWVVAGAVLYAVGRTRMRAVQPAPERSRESLREDVKWARHPTS